MTPRDRQEVTGGSGAAPLTIEEAQLAHQCDESVCLTTRATVLTCRLGWYEMGAMATAREGERSSSFNHGGGSFDRPSALLPVEDDVDALRAKGLGIPVIVVTADIQATTRADCERRGAYAVVEKPLKGQELLRTIQAGAVNLLGPLQELAVAGIGVVGNLLIIVILSLYIAIDRPRIMGSAKGVVRGLMSGEIQFGNMAAPAPLRRAFAVELRLGDERQ